MRDEEEVINESVDNQDEENIDMEFLEDFIVEAGEHLEEIEMCGLTLEMEPDNKDTINSMFRSFHTIKGLAGFVDQNLIGELAHSTETLLDRCRKGSICIDRNIINLILTSADYIKKICDDLSLPKDEGFVKSVHRHMQILSSTCSEVGNDSKGYNSTKEQKEVEDFQESNRAEDSGLNHFKADSYMRVSTSKVDNLIDMIGELIITQSLIEQEAMLRLKNSDAFFNNLLRLSRITRDIQRISMSLRMVSLKSTFQKINRIARDTINELGKSIVFKTDGEDTEIDRSVAEKLLDPLVHLVKNAISHGIEDENERKDKNKPSKGKIEIKAYSRRGNVYIEISDDGKGIDTEKVHKKAIERNLVDPSRIYSEKEIINFIFLPGFSTAEKVDGISGRGVGMDVVKTEISKIGGKVEVKSFPCKGTTFTIRIPINLAVMNGTIVDIGGTNYIIPTLNVRQIIQPKDEQWVAVKGKKAMVNIRDKVIPVINIGEIFGKQINNGSSLIVVLELEQNFLALPVNNVEGRREIVVKPLGEDFSGINFVSGASILGDGKVSLILDIENLFKIGGMI